MLLEMPIDEDLLAFRFSVKAYIGCSKDEVYGA